MPGDAIDRFAELVKSGDYVGALKVLVADRAAAAAVRRVLGDGFLVRLGVMAVLKGADPGAVKRLLRDLGVDASMIDVVVAAMRGDARAAARLAREAGAEKLAALIEAVARLEKPEVVARLARAAYSEEPEFTAKLVLGYIVEYLRKRGYDPRLVDVAEAIGAKQVANMLRVYTSSILEAVAEAIEKAKVDIQAHPQLGRIVKLADEVKRLGEEAQEIAKRLNETSDPAEAARLIERLVEIYEALKRDVEELRKLDVKVTTDLGALRRVIRDASIGVALVAAIRAVQGDTSMAGIVRRLAKVVSRIDKRLGERLAAVAELKPLTLADAICVLKRALPGFSPVTVGGGAGRGRLEVR